MSAAVQGPVEELEQMQALAPRVPEQRVQDYIDFARALYDPGSDTFGNATQSFLAVRPTVKPDSAKDMAKRWKKHPVVRQMREEIENATQQTAGYTQAEYVRMLRRREAFYSRLAAKGVKGAGTAAAAYAKLIGQAGSFLTQKVEVKAPTGEKPRSGEQLAASVQGRLSSWSRLNAPLLPGAEVAVVEASEVRVEEKPLTGPEAREYCPCGKVAHYTTWRTGAPRCEPHMGLADHNLAPEAGGA